MDIDNDSENFNTRSRLNGMLLSKKTTNDTKTSYIRTTNNYKYLKLGNGRIYPFTSIKEKSLIDRIDQKASGIKTIERTEIKTDGHNQNLQSPPTTITKSEQTETQTNSNLLVFSEKRTTVCSNEFNSNNYVLNNISCRKSARDIKASISVNVNKYDKLGRLSKNCRGRKCNEYDYDTLGRPTNIRSNHSNSKNIVIQYLKNTPTANYKLSESGVQKFKFDKMGRSIEEISTIRDKNKTKEAYVWNTDGLLESYSKNNIDRFNLVSYSAGGAEFLKNGIEGSIKFNERGQVTQVVSGKTIGGLKTYSISGLLLEKESNSFNQERHIEITNRYDYLGRIISENRNKSTDSETHITHNYSRTNSDTLINDHKLTSKVIGPISDQVIEEHYKGSSFGYKLDEQNNITMLLTNGHEWKYNKYGEVTSFLFKEEKENGIDNHLFKRSIDNLGTRVSLPDDFTTIGRHDGRLLRSIPANDKDTQEDLQYSRGKLT
ncbi:MAG: hypothetical protein KAG61_03710, partial [Bacteriovoracaceae bacterium]|nr:hypothetical protein [Bacteriovoracaceae bacterium]